MTGILCNRLKLLHQSGGLLGGYDDGKSARPAEIHY